MANLQSSIFNLRKAHFPHGIISPWGDKRGPFSIIVSQPVLDVLHSDGIHVRDYVAADEPLGQERHGALLVVYVVVWEVLLSLAAVVLRLHAEMMAAVELKQGGEEEVHQQVEVFPVHDEAAEGYEQSVVEQVGGIGISLPVLVVEDGDDIVHVAVVVCILVVAIYRRHTLCMEYLTFATGELEEVREPPAVVAEAHIPAPLLVLPHPVHGCHLAVEGVEVVDVLTLHPSVVSLEQAEHFVLLQVVLLYHAVVMICEPDGKVGHELWICFDILQYNRK